MHKFTLTGFLLALLLLGLGCTTKNNVPGNNRPVLVATVIPTPAAAGPSPAELLAAGDFALYRYGAETWAVNLDSGEPMQLRLQPATNPETVLQDSPFLLDNALVTPAGDYFNLPRSGRCTPLLSPDMQRGACADWTIEARGKLQVWLVDLADGGTTPLYEGAAALERQPGPLRWSPDGGRLAFDDNAVVKVAYTHTLTVTTIADFSDMDKRAMPMGWAGERLLVLVDDRLAVVDVTGADSPQFLAEGERLRLRGWSAKRQQGLFSTQTELLLVDLAAGRAQSIYEISADDQLGSGNLSPGSPSAGEPMGPVAWSPDGTQIALRYVWAETESTPARNGWLLIDAQNGATTPLPLPNFEIPYDAQVRWSPDGETLISTGPSPVENCRFDCDPGLYRINLTTGETEVLAERVSGDTLIIVSEGEVQ